MMSYDETSQPDSKPPAALFPTELTGPERRLIERRVMAHGNKAPCFGTGRIGFTNTRPPRPILCSCVKRVYLEIIRERRKAKNV